MTNTENTFRKTLSSGNVLEYAPRFDRRVTEVVDNKIVCRSEKAAREIAADINIWNHDVPMAWQLGHAVVFWKP